MTRTTTLWILLGLLWLSTLPLRPMFDPDEGRYAEIPREMVASGDWITPTLNGLKYFEKPPLQYWATAALYTTFGVHDWTARLWPAALAFLCLPLVSGFARRIGYTPQTSFIAAAILAVSPYFAVCGQVNLLDPGFTFFLSGALFAFVLAQLNAHLPNVSRNWMLATWSALALAVLSKGIVTGVLAGATVAIYLAITRDFSLLRRMHFGLGIPLFLIIAGPWFWLIQSRNPEFFQFFFVREHFERFLTTIHDRVEPFWYFVPILLIGLLPLIGNWRSWSLKAIERDRKPGEFRVELFLLIWCAVVLVLFSASQSKLAPYVLPVMPPLAVLLSRVTQEKFEAYPRAKWISLGLLVILALGIVVAGRQRLGSVSVDSLRWAILLVVGCAAYLVFDRRRSQPALESRWVALAAMSIVGYQLVSLCYATTFHSRSAQALALETSAAVGADTALYSVGQYRHSLAFYLERPLSVYGYTGELEFGMEQAKLVDGRYDEKHFLMQWQKETKAVAFIDPKVYDSLTAAGMPGRVLARDARSVVVARS